MPCFHPLQAWRTNAGEILIGKQAADATPLLLPCSGCLGCRLAYAQAWALRCQLELQQHKSAVFTTLTYDDEHLPLTLQKEALPLWIRAMRKNKGAKSLRFFACAEYGERTKRPHYHAILYGLSMQDVQLIEDKWPNGHTRTEPITAARIAYTAGYVNKKTDYKHIAHERTDPATGEVYTWQPPFKLMSRRPGIGGEARKWAQSWRLYAVKDGHKMPVPRFLHEAWKQQATTEEQENLIYEKSELVKLRNNVNLQALKQITEQRLKESADKRHY